MGLENQINTMQQAGNSPEQIAQAIEVLAKPEQKKWLQSQTPQPLSEIVNEFLSNQETNVPGREINTPTRETNSAIREINAPTREINLPDKENKLPDKPLIATKSGDIGEIKGEDSTGKLIDVNGRVKKFKDEDIIESPLPEKDMADLLEDLLRGIEKDTGEEVSRNVNWAGYNAEHNELQYRPHGGALYTYENISPEDVKLLTSILSKRKTTGQNIIGGWQEGTKSPIGAAMSALIQRLQKERGKGNEYSKKYETLYDWVEPAVTLKKKKNAKRKK